MEGEAQKNRMEEIVSEAEEAAVRKEAIETALRNLEEVHAEREDSQTDLKALLERSSEELKKLTEAREETRIRLASLREKKDFSEQSVRDQEAEELRIRDERISLDAQAREADETLTALSAALEELLQNVSAE